MTIPKGGTAAVGVALARQGYNGPITLTVANPPAGLTVQPGTIPDGQAVGALTVSAAPDAAFGPVALTITGTGKGPSGEIVSTAFKPIIFAQQDNLPTNVVKQNSLYAAPGQPSPLTVETPAEPVEVAHGTGASIPIKITRSEGAEGALTVTPLPLSGGLAVPEAKIDEKANEGTATVNAAPEAPLGLTSIALTAKGKIGGKDRVIALPLVNLNVIRPVALELAAPTVEIKPGQTVEVKGKVVRKGSFKEPVTVKLDGLPAGVKAEPVTVAARRQRVHPETRRRGERCRRDD